MKSRLLARLGPRPRRWLLRLGVAFALYSLAGFFLLPPLLKWQLVKRLPGITQRQAAVRQVTLSVN
jgi:hypothetical protein